MRHRFLRCGSKRGAVLGDQETCFDARAACVARCAGRRSRPYRRPENRVGDIHRSLSRPARRHPQSNKLNRQWRHRDRRAEIRRIGERRNRKDIRRESAWAVMQVTECSKRGALISRELGMGLISSSIGSLACSAKMAERDIRINLPARRRIHINYGDVISTHERLSREIA